MIRVCVCVCHLGEWFHSESEGFHYLTLHNVTLTWLYVTEANLKPQHLEKEFFFLFKETSGNNPSSAANLCDCNSEISSWVTINYVMISTERTWGVEYLVLENTHSKANCFFCLRL